MNTLMNRQAKRYLGLGMLVALGTIATAPAFAQSWSITRGYNVGALLPSETRKIAGGGTYLSGGARYLVDTEDPTYPITGQSMDCRWFCKISADGNETDCLTMCAGVDRDGDLFTFRGFGGNTYEVGPGTGKYMNATGGGTFEMLQPDDPALTAIRFKGTLRLK